LRKEELTQLGGRGRARKGKAAGVALGEKGGFKGAGAMRSQWCTAVVLRAATAQPVCVKLCVADA